jgi:hypothetical protein
MWGGIGWNGMGIAGSEETGGCELPLRIRSTLPAGVTGTEAARLNVVRLRHRW